MNAEEAYRKLRALEEMSFAEQRARLWSVVADAESLPVLFAAAPAATAVDIDVIRHAREVVRTVRQIHEQPNEPFHDPYQAALAIRAGLVGRYDIDYGRAHLYVPYRNRPLSGERSQEVYSFGFIDDAGSRSAARLVTGLRDSFPWLGDDEAALVALVYGHQVPHHGTSYVTVATWDPFVALALAAQGESGIGSVVRINVPELLALTARTISVRYPTANGIPRIRNQRLVLIDQDLPTLVEDCTPFAVWFRQRAASDFADPAQGCTPEVLTPTRGDPVPAVLATFDDPYDCSQPLADFAPREPAEVYRAIALDAIADEEEWSPQPSERLVLDQHLEALIGMYVVLVRRCGPSTAGGLHAFRDAARIAGRRAANALPADVTALAEPMANDPDVVAVLATLADAWQAHEAGDWLAWIRLTTGY
jgi:hypothetical protein